MLTIEERARELEKLIARHKPNPETIAFLKEYKGLPDEDLARKRHSPLKRKLSSLRIRATRKSLRTTTP